MKIIATISVVFILLIGVNARRETPRETLRLGVLISQEGEFDFTGFIPAMRLALETIENDTTLPFTFDIVLNDSMVRSVIEPARTYVLASDPAITRPRNMPAG